MNISKKIWISLLVLMAVIGLREGGYVIFHYADSRFNNRMQIKLHADYFVDKDGERLPSRETKKIDSQQPVIAVISWNVGSSTNPRENALTSIEERLKDVLAGDESLKVTIRSLQLDGLYWLPIYKSGSCRYTFDVEIVGANTRVYRGNGEGEMTFSTFGTMSVNEVKENLSNQIATDIASNLRRETK